MATEKKQKEPKLKNKHQAVRGSLTKPQEIFIQELIKGNSQRQSLYKAYPHTRKWTDSAADSRACLLLKQPKVRARYDAVLSEIQQSEQQKTMWTREEAIKTLRFIVDENTQEIERINQAYNQELNQLEQQMIEQPEKAQAIFSQYLKTKKSRRMSITTNKGITDAVSELNKMQGFNEENINLNGSVLFTGEELLEE